MADDNTLQGNYRIEIGPDGMPITKFQQDFVADPAVRDRAEETACGGGSIPERPLREGERLFATGGPVDLPRPEAIRLSDVLMHPVETRIQTVRPPLGTAMNWATIQDAVVMALPAEWSETAKTDALEQIRSTLLGEGVVLIEKRSRTDAIAAKDPVMLALSATIEAAQHAVETRVEELCSQLDQGDANWAQQHQPPPAMRRQIFYPPNSPEPTGVASVMTAPADDGEPSGPPPRVFNHLLQDGESLWEDATDLAGRRYTWSQLNDPDLDGPFGPLTLQAVSFEQES